MKIAYLCSDFGVPIFGTNGSSVHIQETTRALAILGHEVRIFSPRAETEGEVAGLGEVHHLPLSGIADEMVRLATKEDAGLPRHLVREWRSILYSEQSQRVLLPDLVEFEPEVIYERYSLFAYAGLELARKLRVPFILEVNSPLSLESCDSCEHCCLRWEVFDLLSEFEGSCHALLVLLGQLWQDLAQQLFPRLFA